MITEFPIPSGFAANGLRSHASSHGSAGPKGIATVTPTTLGFTEETANAIGTIVAVQPTPEDPPVGTITQTPIPVAEGQAMPKPTAITTDPVGHLWFTESGSNRIGEMVPGNPITFNEYAIPATGNPPVNGTPMSITCGSDGNLWFTESGSNQIGKITTGGALTMYAIPSSASSPVGITASPTGALWFTESDLNKIGKITMSGQVTERSIPVADTTPYGITVGPDGNLWFTQFDPGITTIGRITLVDSLAPTSVRQFPGANVTYSPNGWNSGPTGGVCAGSPSGVICGTVSDDVNGSGVSSVKLTIQGPSGYYDGASWQPAPVTLIAPVNGSTWNFPLPATALSAGGQGLFTITRFATDVAGNAEAPAQSSFLFDSVAPTPPVIDGPAADGLHVVENLTVSFHGDGDLGATTLCALDNAAFAPCPSPDPIGPLSLGPHTFSVEERDAAGNTSPVTTRSFVTVHLDHLSVALSKSKVAWDSGAILTFTVLDGANQPVTGFSGGASFDDLTHSMLPLGPVTWLNGLGTVRVGFSAPLVADRATVTVAGVSAQSGVFSLIGELEHFKVSGPVTSASNTPTTVTFTAQDVLNQTVTGFAGQVELSDVSHLANTTGPVTWVSGFGTLPVTFSGPAVSDRVTVTGGGVSGQSGSFSLVGPFDHFKVSGPGTPASNTDTSVTFTAQDALNQTVRTFSGAVEVTDTSHLVAAAGQVTWLSGFGTLPVTFTGPAVSDRVTVTGGGVSSQSAAFSLVGPLDHFKVSGPGTPNANADTTVTFTAQDVLNQTVRAFSGAVAVNDLAHLVTAAGPVSWLNGFGTLPVTFSGPGVSDRVTVVGGGATGTSATFNVIGPVDHFKVSGPSNPVANIDTTVTFTALDALNQTVKDFSGPVTVNDSAHSLTPTGPVTWLNGVGTARVRFDAASVSDRATVTAGLASGSSSVFTVRAR